MKFTTTTIPALAIRTSPSPFLLKMRHPFMLNYLAIACVQILAVAGLLMQPGWATSYHLYCAPEQSPACRRGINWDCLNAGWVI
jgi:hypothetical protein